MAKLIRTIKTEIREYIIRCSGAYSSWYVGIATYPRKRLFEEHNVDEKNGNWIYREATNSNAAREVEQYFVERLGTDGGTGGGDESSRYAYAYKKTPCTEE